MKDCSKFIKKLYIGIVIFFIMYLILKIRLISSIIIIPVAIGVYIFALTYILPYFRCYGENMRNNKKFKN